MHAHAPVEERSEEDRRELDRLYESIRDRLFKRGQRLGQRTGRMVGQHGVLLKLLTLKFGSLSSFVVARVKSLEKQSEIDRLVEQILTATSLEEFRLAWPWCSSTYATTGCPGEEPAWEWAGWGAAR